MMLPNFLIIGAAKAGTTSLYHYLKQHPDVYMSPDKEPRFFAFEGDTSGIYPYTELAEYEKLFNGVTTEKAIGEASTYYLYSKDAPQRIRDRVPAMKLIAVLRSPIDRAYSNHLYWRREGKEAEPDFSVVVDRELKHVREHGSDAYLERGMYGQQLQRYFDLFPRKQIRVYLYEDLRDSTQDMLSDIYSFLEVDAAFKPDLSRNYNISTVPDSGIKHIVYAFLVRQERLRKWLLEVLPDHIYWNVLLPRVKSLSRALRGKREVAKAEPMDERVRERLAEFYEQDIRLTESLIDRDLSGWLVRKT